MKNYMVYFKDNTNSDPSAFVERMVVEGEDEADALSNFHKMTDYECSVRSVDELSL